ncbi:MAG: hypothetical protein WD638_03740 [Nitriliruptoraceae bacterium]
MRHAPPITLSLVIVAVVVAGCAGLDTRVEDLRGDAEELSEAARLCLAVTRTISAVESGSPDTAEDAAEEVFAQAPDDLAATAREVVELLGAAAAEGDASLRDPELRETVDRLREQTRELCGSNG